MTELRVLSAEALSTLGALTVQEGPETPRAQSTKLADWLADSVSVEQARRRGDAQSSPAFPALTLPELSDAAACCVGLFHSHHHLRALSTRPLTEGEERVRQEHELFFHELSEVLIEMGRARSGPMH